MYFTNASKTFPITFCVGILLTLIRLDPALGAGTAKPAPPPAKPAATPAKPAATPAKPGSPAGPAKAATPGSPASSTPKPAAGAAAGPTTSHPGPTTTNGGRSGATTANPGTAGSASTNAGSGADLVAGPGCARHCGQRWSRPRGECRAGSRIRARACRGHDGGQPVSSCRRRQRCSGTPGRSKERRS